MIQVARTFGFEASHRLEGYPPGHRMTRLHGHSYQVTVSLRSDRVVELEALREYITEHLDHRHLGVGDVHYAAGGTDPAALDFDPTVGNIARHLFEVAEGMFGHRVAAVRVRVVGGTVGTATVTR